MLGSVTKLFAKFFGTKSERDLKLVVPIVAQINQEYAKLTSISDEELRQKTVFFKQIIAEDLKLVDQEIVNLQQKIAEQPDLELNAKEQIFNKIDDLGKKRNTELEVVLNKILPQAFAVVRETARRWKENKKITVKATEHDLQIAQKRAGVDIEGENAIWHNRWLAAGNEVVWEMLHYDVQLIGGIVLHQGKISEMATGEGKTLVATLPAYLNALAGKGVHIVTVNDYLAKRDSEWMGPIFEFHGLKVDCIDKHQPNSQQRKNAYLADITYGTNNEYGFDYLRDNMVRSPQDLMQRKHHYAMVDEVDSVLVDDARTPLIIAGPVSRGSEEQEYQDLRPFVVRLVEAQKLVVNQFLVEAKKKMDGGKEEENGALDLFRAYKGFPKSKPLIKFLGETGIKQKMQKVESFYMQDNSRQMPKAVEPLFFTIDERNNSIELTQKGLDLITSMREDKHFFVIPSIAVELSNIDKNNDLDEEQKLFAKEQLYSDYETKARRIHAMTQLLRAFALYEKDVEYIVQNEKVQLVDEQTGRILDGRRYSDGLHQAIESKENVKIEESTQTYATVTLQNYFRMYHKLSGMTGTAETEASEFWEIYKLDVVVIPTNKAMVRKDKQDRVYKTTREKYNAVAEEIQKLTSEGRPVLVGTTSVEISEILSRMLNMKKIQHQVLNAKQHAKEAEIVGNAGIAGTVTIATNMAGRGTDIKLSPEAKKAGGLAIIGTERHESRRIDRQLRGRSGRQGDTGSSQFFVSLEDSLMRLFGSDRIASIMDRLGLEEGEVIEHSMITKSIERAQTKVEENNFGTRKRLLEYDDVMNKQREVIYKRRRNALFGERLALDIMKMFEDTAVYLVNNFTDEELKIQVHAKLNVTVNLPKATGKPDLNKNINQVYDQAYKHYTDTKNRIIAEAMPVLASVFEQSEGRVGDIFITFTDGKRMINITTDLRKALETNGKSLIQSMEQSIVLVIVDQLWKEHLRDMDDLRQQVSFSYLEQKDPLLLYKFEAFELFKAFLAELNQQTISFLSKIDIFREQEQPAQVQEAAKVKQVEPKQAKLVEQKAESQSSLAPRPERQQQVVEEKVEVTQPLKSNKVADRNDKVTVRYHDGTTKTDKFKKLEEDLKNNRCVLV
ncbi:MAG: preprotein translocase subunit SecA [Bacteroidetes bacterium]|nr:MAG: preprotein translocase subunit SecA [Bacteroidota bacterium]